ncbi:MAG TPA: aldo/keto reductase [bacterium]|nr:aldo/keto reductase [bacterium]HPG45965.1 aldo/keto reductase [bacterium]HPM97787.1 aldo/keto reductase [bacterium]
MQQSKPNTDMYNVPWTTDSYNGMPYRVLGRSGLRVPLVGLGTWKIGFPETGDQARVDEKSALAILDRAVQLGVTFWDTANRYNNASGNSERVIGRWLAANPDQRRNIILATKLFGGMDGFTPNHSRLSRLNILESFYASLDRLMLDGVDLLFFHAYDPHTPVEESLAAVEDLVRQDMVRYFAVSNYSIEQIRLLRSMEERLSCRVRIVAVQNQYDIVNGESPQHRGVLAEVQNLGISFIAWSPLARGLLTDRYLKPENAGSGDRLFDEGTLESDCRQIDTVRRLAALAAKWHLPLSELVIAKMLTMSGMGPIIASVSSIEQLESNAHAAKIQLSIDRVEAINQALKQDSKG